MRKNPKFPLQTCANGCGTPPCPPSLVICRKCMDDISAKLKALAESKTEAAQKCGEVVPKGVGECLRLVADGK